jgi:hypothetical protein
VTSSEVCARAARSHPLADDAQKVMLSLCDRGHLTLLEPGVSWRCPQADPLAAGEYLTGVETA